MIAGMALEKIFPYRLRNHVRNLFFGLHAPIEKLVLTTNVIFLVLQKIIQRPMTFMLRIYSAKESEV